MSTSQLQLDAYIQWQAWAAKSRASSRRRVDLLAEDEDSIDARVERHMKLPTKQEKNMTEDLPLPLRLKPSIVSEAENCVSGDALPMVPLRRAEKITSYSKIQALCC